MDKVWHFLVSYFLASVSTIIFQKCGLPIVYGIIFALVCGIGKEIVDIKKRGFEMDSLFDFLCDLVGIGFAWFLYFLS